MRVLVVTSVAAEAKAVGSVEAEVVVAGIGRTNAGAATAEALVRAECGGDRFDAVLCAGMAGALPGGGLDLGDLVVASRCTYVEEGIVTPDGFADMEALGFRLGDFTGNVVPVDGRLLGRLGEVFRAGPVATVATCSGTDAAAAEVVHRSGAVAEAMEGAAVVHAARRLGVPAIELRAISNTTGDRARQVWDLKGALTALGHAVPKAVAAIQEA
jgi:futalosine hydrolase